MNKTALLSSVLIACAVFLGVSGCSDSNSSPNPDTTAPTVSSTNPAASATGVASNAVITVTFSEAMDCSTLTPSTFTVKDSTGNTASGTVACSGSAATFTPSSLDYLVTYTATITTGAKDLAGNSCAGHTWSFTIDTSPTPLISAATVKAWVDNGLVNASGTHRVVILDVNGASTYNSGHIPGAQMFDPSPTVTTAPLYQNRQEGPAVDVNMVPDGSHMDAVVHHFGIDGNTTIVFTGSTLTIPNVMNATRAYWTFRYWGFPKENLKVLDGLNNNYNKAYGLTTVAPSITPSTYSVKSNAALRDDLRASLSEMMAVAKGDVQGFILDGRSGELDASYAGTLGSTPGVFGNKAVLVTTQDYVVFEGHMNNAKALIYTSMYDVTHDPVSDTTTVQFKPASALQQAFASVGVNQSKPTYVHCRTGVIASVQFFVLDAILGWNAVNYDGSWSQWGQLSANSANGGRLDPSSPWQTDTADYSSLVAYNHASKPVELLALDGSACTATLATDGTTISNYPSGCTLVDPESAVTSGNQIEEADALYMGH